MAELPERDENTAVKSESPNLLTPLFEDGKILKETPLAEIRGRLDG